ncbi:hypothetical protein C8R42DRAFT_718932 [Lentinula raphanica]|nr:hypothetical protein C8R42DRAFT_718932 [Lentinula raphanica]
MTPSTHLILSFFSSLVIAKQVADICCPSPAPLRMVPTPSSSQTNHLLPSGLFAALTLGYMSLDQTQLNVLSLSGTPEQRKYDNKIKPIRANGHLLLVTLLLADMIVNETLPVLGGGVQSIVVSTVTVPPLISFEFIGQLPINRDDNMLDYLASYASVGAWLSVVHVHSLHGLEQRKPSRRSLHGLEQRKPSRRPAPQLGKALLVFTAA